jgi:hypothetical protein
MRQGRRRSSPRAAGPAPRRRAGTAPRGPRRNGHDGAVGAGIDSQFRRQACLADAWLPGDHDQTSHTRVSDLAQAGVEMVELTLPADEGLPRGRNECRWQRRDVNRRPRKVERPIASDDGALERPQLCPGFEAQLVSQRLSYALIRPERIRLSSAPIQRQHQLTPPPFSQRFPHDGRLELTH